ncbi:MAG: hypothetical protein KatS3mg060_1194 [Dehalococcoidia bacterium]|nr:MAG: hypothetical protein KatS3mg060_1194 [Dehalococcoidia bacterium]
MEIVTPLLVAFRDEVARDALEVLATIDGRVRQHGMRSLTDDELYAIRGCVEVIGQALRLWETQRFVSVEQELRRRGAV